MIYVLGSVTSIYSVSLVELFFINLRFLRGGESTHLIRVFFSSSDFILKFNCSTALMTPGRYIIIEMGQD